MTHRGLTLVEILVVLLIIGVVAVGTAPALARVSGEDQTTSSIRELVTVLNRAHTTAVERASTVRVLVDPASGRYWVFATDPSIWRELDTGTVVVEPGARLATQSQRVSFTFEPTGPSYGDSLFVETPNGGAKLGVYRWTGTPYVRP